MYDHCVRTCETGEGERVVSCPDHKQRENINIFLFSPFHFCAQCHDVGTPIRLLYVSDIIYCHEWQPKKARQLKRYAEDYTRQNQRTVQQRNARTFVNGRCVFLSLPTGSVKLLSFKCQGLSEVDRGFKLRGSSFLGVQ